MTRASASFLALSAVGFIASAPANASDTPNQGGGTPQTQAQERGSDSRRDVIVTGMRDAEVESPKATAPLLDTPQTITVISDQTLRKQNLLTLRDALQTIPGITFGAGEGGGGYGDSINLRGYSANNDLTVDGLRDSAQYSRTDPFNLQQIEVYNGANSASSGAGSLGGTINMVSKVPQARDLTIVSGGVGTDNYYRGTIDANHRVNDLLAVRLNAMIHRNDVPGRDIEQYKRWGVAPSVTIGVEGPTSLTLGYVHQKDENTPVYGVPYYAIIGGPVPGVDDSDYFGTVNTDHQDSTIDRLSATFRHQFSDGVSLRNLTRWQRVVQNTATSAPQGTYCLANGQTPLGVACPAGQNVPGTYYPSGPRGFVRNQMNSLLVNQLDLRIVSGERGRIHNTLAVGASASNEDYELDTGNLFRNAGGALPNPVIAPVSIANPDTTYAGPINFIRSGKSYGDTDNFAVYAFDTLELGSMFELNGGARWEKVRTRFRADTFTTPATGSVYARGADQLSDEELFSYRVGAVFKPSATTALYIAHGTTRTPGAASVRAGCGTVIAGTTLDPCDVPPEKGRSFEIGAKADLFDRHLQLTAAVFRNERTNYRVATNDPVVTTLPVTDGRSRVDGIALGVSGNITKAWSIFANYTYLDGEVIQSVSNYCLANPGPRTVGTTVSSPCGNSTAIPDPQAGQRLGNTPRHSGSLFTTYTLPFGLQFGYGLTYQGSFTLNNSALVTPLAPTTALTPVFASKAYTTHRAFLSYEVMQGLTAQLNVQNLTNARYFTGIRNNGWAVPGEKRSAVLSLYYSF
ncbi:TonB-dependent receptor [Sphingomonas sp.]|uniref:TonB-dependent receptor n=1 Tax=Sphingomonas sp. TaxID=28214 RepID=UPI002DD65D35|nr:TonB-dependent receptor [Sphingomonas sp.]